jgi:hypothetical protein
MLWRDESRMRMLHPHPARMLNHDPDIWPYTYTRLTAVLRPVLWSLAVALCRIEARLLLEYSMSTVVAHRKDLSCVGVQ